MNMRSVIGLLFCSVLIISTPVSAQQKSQPQTIDRSQAAAKAQQRVKGRVLRVDQSSGKYRVKVLKKSGRVVSVDVDKRSGQVRQASKTKDNDR
ncbi:PepSY domain-containing protein [Salinimonas marina]|uniref:PepSY domain-containing protein n=2 Tax=Salinimonas marina TaxID=2785918 RepID=A0A7S9HCC2_9ALTE|nr:PepSY domain-containing protein [Salinimonas marina]